MDICKGLIPVDLKQRALLLSQSFGQLSYQSRYLTKASGVPTSFWKHQRDKYLYCFLLEGHGGLPKHFIDVLAARGYLFNTRFGFGASEDQIAESEYIFEHKSVPGAFIRLLTPTSYPPALGDQICFSTDHYATSNQFLLGSHEFVFEREDTPYLLLIKPAPWTTRENGPLIFTQILFRRGTLSSIFKALNFVAN